MIVFKVLNSTNGSTTVHTITDASNSTMLTDEDTLDAPHIGPTYGLSDDNKNTTSPATA